MQGEHLQLEYVYITVRGDVRHLSLKCKHFYSLHFVSQQCKRHRHYTFMVATTTLM